MKTYAVYDGVYPFEFHLGTVQAPDELTALNIAIDTYGKDFPHPVVMEEPNIYVH